MSNDIHSMANAQLLMVCCNLVSDVWELTKWTQSCLDWPTILLTHAAIGIMTDIVIFALPLPSLLSLRVNGRTKCTQLNPLHYY